MRYEGHLRVEVATHIQKDCLLLGQRSAASRFWQVLTCRRIDRANRILSKIPSRATEGANRKALQKMSRRLELGKSEFNDKGDKCKGKQRSCFRTGQETGNHAG